MAHLDWAPILLQVESFFPKNRPTSASIGWSPRSILDCPYPVELPELVHRQDRKGVKTHQDQIGICCSHLRHLAAMGNRHACVRADE